MDVAVGGNAAINTRTDTTIAIVKNKALIVPVNNQPQEAKPISGRLSKLLTWVRPLLLVTCSLLDSEHISSSCRLFRRQFRRST